MMIRDTERNWLERIKRKHKLKTLSEVVQKLRKFIKDHKMEDEL